MAREQLQDPDADWDREDGMPNMTGSPAGDKLGITPAEVVIPTEDVMAALADPSTAHLKEGGAAAGLLLTLGDHFARDYATKPPTLIVRKP